MARAVNNRANKVLEKLLWDIVPVPQAVVPPARRKTIIPPIPFSDPDLPPEEIIHVLESIKYPKE